jgi:hypothetical protein
MPDNKNQPKQSIGALAGATVLSFEGHQLEEGLWEIGVYLGKDGYVYYIYAEQKGGQVKKTVLGKRKVGEYLRWVDGLFLPGTLPSENNAIHFRAARKLREFI